MRMAERPLDELGLPEGYPLQLGWELTPREVQALRNNSETFVLLDVREPREIELAAIEGAVCIAMGEVKSRLAELEEHAEGRVVVMCHHGARSMQVTSFLREQGFEDVNSMAGGIDLWSRDIDPSVPRY
jgi:rhodanese-related sulfurtransferase